MKKLTRKIFCFRINSKLFLNLKLIKVQLDDVDDGFIFLLFFLYSDLVQELL